VSIVGDVAIAGCVDLFRGQVAKCADPVVLQCGRDWVLSSGVVHGSSVASEFHEGLRFRVFNR